MATFSPGVSNLTITNYSRIGHCSQDIIPTILQELLLLKEPTHRIRADCLSNNYLSRHLRADEWVLINNAPVNGYDSFDIPLIYKLLRNLHLVPPPTRGWDNHISPAIKELTIGDDIERLRRKRNAILHRGNTNVSDAELTDIFDLFKDIGNRLEIFLGKANGEFVSKFQHIETCCMDEQSEKLFIDTIKNTALQEVENKDKIKEVMEQTVKNTESIRQLTTQTPDRQRNFIQQWTRDDVKFIRTDSSEKLFNILETNSIVNVLGNSGMGKTSTSRHVALRMLECGYDVLLVRSPLEILQHIITGNKMLFVIDDICGRYSVVQHDVEDWERYMEDIENCVSLKTIKILTTCRLQVFQSRQFKELKLLTSCCFNMLTEENAITIKEKRILADSYANTKYSCQMSDDEIQQYDSFPLLCRMSSIFKDSVTEILSFMRNPYMLFEQEIEKLASQTDRMFISALGIVVIFNNELDEGLLIGDINDEQRKVFDDVFEACGEQRGSSRNRILSCLNTFEDVYMMKHDSCYSFLHIKIFDLLTSYFGKKTMMLTVMLKYCSVSFLCERFWFSSLGAVNKDSLVCLPVGKEPVFLARILHEVSNKTLFDVFSCNLMKAEEFRTRIISTLLQLGFEVISRILKLSHVGMTILHIACQHGYRELLLFFLKYNSPLNNCDYAGRTPLHVACRYEDTCVVDILLNARVETNNYKIRGFTPLFEACLLGKTDVVNLLLKNGSDPNLCTKRLLIPLVTASEKGYTTIVKLLLLHSANVNQTNTNGETALHLASKNCHLEVVSSLIENGANVNIETQYLETPLYFASIDPRCDIITLLMSHRADPTKKSSQTQLTPVSLAIKNGRNDIAHIMLQSIVHSDSMYTLLEHACENGNTELVQAIADFDIDTNQELNCGYTSLQIVCKEDFLSIATILVENGADVNLFSRCGETPTQLASFYNNKDIVSFLVSKGADANFSDQSKGMPPALHIACLLNENEMVQVLVENNADVNESALLTMNMINEIRDLDYVKQMCSTAGRFSAVKVCPLEIACFEKNLNNLEILITNGADINILTEMGIRPLVISCFYENMPITELLLKHKANANVLSDIEKICLNYIRHGDDGDIIEMAIFNKQLRGFPTTPLHVALMVNNVKLVEMLLHHRCRTNIVCSINPVVIAFLTSKCSTTKIYPNYLIAQFWEQRRIQNLLPIHIACLVGNHDLFELIFNSMIQYNREHDITVTTRQLICTQGRFLTPSEFLHNVHETTIFHFTPLQIAAMKHYWDICKTMLKKGIGNDSVFEVSSFLLGCLSGNEESINNCIYTGLTFKTSVAHLAYENNQTEVLDALFANGVHADIGLDANIRTVFYIACCNGHLEIVKKLYFLNANINIRHYDDNNKTPLHVATEKNHLNLVEFLLSKNVIVEAADTDGNTPLHIASIHGFKKIAEQLLKRNANPFAVTNKGENAFHLCCKHNKTKYLSVLLNFVFTDVYSQYNDVIQYTDIPTSGGLTLSYFAFSNYNKKNMRTLIDHKADINKRINGKGETLLSLSCKERRLGWVRFLIENSADINICNVDHYTAIYVTCRLGYDEITRELLKHDVNVNQCCYEGYTPLYFCCLGNKFKLVEQLLMKGADPNTLSIQMESLLIESCQNGRKRIAEILLRYGADANYCHYEGETALHFAFHAGDAVLMEILIDHNASWSVCAHEREYYLYLACKKKMKEIIYLMMKYDNTINVNAIALNDKTPFYICCQHSSIELVNFLIELGGDVNMLINGNDTPFHPICLHNNLAQIESIMIQGLVSPINIQKEFIFFLDCNRMDMVYHFYNHYRQVLHGSSLDTAWFSAVKCGNVNTMKLLANLGVNINTQRDDGKTALHIASSEGNICLIEELLNFSQIDIGIKSHEGVSAFHDACDGDNINVVQVLLDNNADIGEKTENGTSPLMIACSGWNTNLINCLLTSNQHEVIKQFEENASEILSECYDIPNMRPTLRKLICLLPKDGYITNSDKAIHFACRKYDDELLKSLLNQNHDVDSINELEETPILISISLECTECLGVLLNANADVNMVSTFHDPTSELRFENVTPLHMACFSDDELSTEMLLNRSANCNSVTTDFELKYVTSSEEKLILKTCSCLFFPIVNRNFEIFSMLLKNISDTKLCLVAITVWLNFIHGDIDDLADEVQMATVDLNLFQISCLVGNMKMTKTLIKLNIFNVNAPFAVTPMVLTTDNELMTDIMQRYGYTDQNWVTYITPLMYAALVQDDELIDILVKNHADQNIGATLSLLHIIALQENLMNVILSSGNVLFLSKECLVSPFHILLLNNKEDLFSLLTTDSINMDCYANLTALHVVCFRGNADLLLQIIGHNVQTFRQFQICNAHLSLMSDTALSNGIIYRNVLLSKQFNGCLQLSSIDIACFIGNWEVLARLLIYGQAQNTDDLQEFSPTFIRRLFMDSEFEFDTELMCWPHENLNSNVSNVFLYAILCKDAVYEKYLETETLQKKQTISEWVYTMNSGLALEDFIRIDHFLLRHSIQTIFEVNLAQILFFRKDFENMDKLIMYPDTICRIIKMNFLIFICITNGDLKPFLKNNKRMTEIRESMEFTAVELSYFFKESIPRDFFDCEKARNMKCVFTPLIITCLHNNISNVKGVLTTTGTDIDSVIKPSSLHLSCFVDVCAPIRGFLSDTVSNPVAEITALHVACAKQNDDIVQLLLLNNCDVNIQAIMSPIHIAQLLECSEAMEQCERFLKTGPLRFGKMCAVHIASLFDKEYGLDSLLRVDCNFDRKAVLTSLHLFALSDDEYHVPLRDNNYNAYSELSPLHIAVITDNYEMCKCLLRRGADIEQPAHVYPLHIMFDYCNNLSEMITEISLFSLTSLQIACVGQNYSVCEKLAKKSPNIHTNALLFIEFHIKEEVSLSTYSNISTLLLIFLVNDPYVARIVLELEPNVNEKSDISLWHICLFRPCAMLKLQNFVDKEVVFHLAPLHVVSLLNEKDSIIMLLEKDADVNICGHFTPLYVTLYNNAETKVSMNTHNHSQLILRTPLHLAAEAGYMDICEILLLYGADTTVETNIAGLHPWHFALIHGHIDVLTRLLSRPSKIERGKFLFVLALYMIRKRCSKLVLYNIGRSRYFILLQALYKYLIGVVGFTLSRRCFY